MNTECRITPDRALAAARAGRGPGSGSASIPPPAV